jgi:hypothetical protein
MEGEPPESPVKRRRATENSRWFRVVIEKAESLRTEYKKGIGDILIAYKD